MSEQSQRFFDFGDFRLDMAERLLLRDGEPVPLTPMAFKLLVVLVERRGSLVEKEYLVKALWPDTVASDANLNSIVSTLRRGLGGQHYIQTVPKSGYRFKVPESESEAHEPESADDGGEVVLEKHTTTRVVTREEEGTGAVGDLRRQPARAALPADVDTRRGRRWGGWGVALGTLGLLVAVISGVLYQSRTGAEGRGDGTKVAGAPPLQSIAVLPFKTIGEGGEDEYLSLGMTDALITRLGNVRRVVVRPTSAVRRYVGPMQDPLVAGREQGVEAVLDGSVQRVGDRVRVTVQLFRTRDGASLWSAKFDERFNDIFAVQDSISSHVMRGLLVELNPEEAEQVGRRGGENIEAYEAYLKGLYFWDKRNKAGYQKALEYFQRAVELDPTYARAYVGLSNAYVFLGGRDRASQAEAISKQRAAAKKALELDETLAEAHAALGLIAMDSDWPEAEREFRRAIELNPNYATAHQWYGEFLAWMGHFDEAITESRRAHALDPLSLIISTDLGKVYTLAGRYDDAISQYKRTLELDPDFQEALALLAVTYSTTGRHEEALGELRKIKGFEKNPMCLSFLVYFQGRAGRTGEARQALGRLNELSRQTYVSPQWMAVAHAGLGETDRAFGWLDRIFEERAQGMITLKVAPEWDGLRADPRFEVLLRRSGF